MWEINKFKQGTILHLDCIPLHSPFFIVCIAEKVGESWSWNYWSLRVIDNRDGERGRGRESERKSGTDFGKCSERKKRKPEEKVLSILSTRILSGEEGRKERNGMLSD